MNFSDVIRVSHQLTFGRWFGWTWLNHWSSLKIESFLSLVRKEVREMYSTWPAESKLPGSELITGAQGRKELWVSLGAARGPQTMVGKKTRTSVPWLQGTEFCQQSVSFKEDLKPRWDGNSGQHLDFIPVTRWVENPAMLCLNSDL